MFYGTGFADADDVVGHEMSHGVIDRTSDLFYLVQSGAINESLADIMGEIVDHRFVSDGDTTGDWRLGEDLPGGAIRDLEDPTAFSDPDRMTSPSTSPTPATKTTVACTQQRRRQQDGVLISQGGTFNGKTITGIDARRPPSRRRRRSTST